MVSSEERRKLFVHSVLAQLTATSYGSKSVKDTESEGVCGISDNLAKKVYNRLAPILQLFVSEEACKCFATGLNLNQPVRLGIAGPQYLLVEEM